MWPLKWCFRHSCAFALSFFCHTALAVDFEKYFIDPDDGNLDASRYLSEVPYGFLPVPIIITEPAVGTGLGVVGIFFHESAEQKKQRMDTIAQTHKAILPTNVSFLGLAGTENGTKGIGGGHMGFWMQDRVRYKGFALYPDANLDFYSLGGLELPNGNGVEMNLVGPVVLQELKMRITPDSNLFAGVRQVYRKVDLSLANAANFNPFESQQLNQQLQNFLDEYANFDITTSGVGALVEYDSRNNPFNPEKGYLFSTRYQIFDEGIGSDKDYEDYNITTLGYWTLTEQWLLGLRFQVDGVDARDNEALPPYVLPFVDLRGIPAVRYQGNRVALVEAELDWRITPRWKLGIFSGSGRTAAHFSDLDEGDAVDTIGTGFRYLVARRYGFQMGVDIAKGPEETAFYIQAGSSW